MPMICPVWSGHYTKESDTVYQTQSAVTGLGTLPGSQHQPTWHDARWRGTGCIHKWNPWISVNESAERGSWGYWRLNSICLNQWEKRRRPRGPNRVSQDPKVGVTVAVTETTSPPPSLLTCQSAGKQTEWPMELTVKMFNFSGSREPLHIFRVRLVDINHT